MPATATDLAEAIRELAALRAALVRHLRRMRDSLDTLEFDVSNAREKREPGVDIPRSTRKDRRAAAKVEDRKP